MLPGDLIAYLFNNFVGYGRKGPKSVGCGRRRQKIVGCGRKGQGGYHLLWAFENWNLVVKLPIMTLPFLCAGKEWPSPLKGVWIFFDSPLPQSLINDSPLTNCGMWGERSNKLWAKTLYSYLPPTPPWPLGVNNFSFPVLEAKYQYFQIKK